MALLDMFKQRPPDKENNVFVLDASEMATLARTHTTAYRDAQPFPHVVIDDFLPPDMAQRALADFPPPDAPLWLDWKVRDTVHQPRKLGVGSAERLTQSSPALQHILFTLNSHAMLNFLETLTGIVGLIPDPHFSGGGLHQILPGGKLAIHSDFNFDQRLKLYRRINVLIFLNVEWKKEYGGQLELWNSTMKQCGQRILPIFNRCVIFNTDRDSYHGHPDPLHTPNHVTRKSLALYYYTRDPKPGDDDIRTTDWQLRPHEHE